MPETVTTTVFRLDELSASARDQARAWYRHSAPLDEWHAFVFDDFVVIADILGIEIATRPVRLYGGGTRDEPRIWFSVFRARATAPASRGPMPMLAMPAGGSGTMRPRIRSCTGSPTPSPRYSGAISTSSRPASAIPAAIITNIA